MQPSVLAAIATIAVAATIAAQQQPPPPSFRARTDLVEIEVTARGGNGAFVSNLSIDDFEVRDNGVPQRIDHLLLNTNPRVKRSAADAGAQATTSNRRVFVIVFDSPHLTPGGFRKTQAAARTLFDRHFIDMADLGGVVSDGRMAGNRLSADRSELLKAVSNAKPASNRTSQMIEEREWPRLTTMEAIRIVVNDDRALSSRVATRACQDDPDFCRRLDPAPLVREKAVRFTNDARRTSERTAQTLKALLDGLSNVPGPKTVLLMTEGFISEENWPSVRESVATAARANARVYTLDARGLDRDAVTSLGGDVADDTEARLLNQFDPGGEAVNSLAVDTGGFVVRNTNVFDTAVARIVDDASSYYVIGFQPSTPRDGKFHTLSVTVTRPGVTVRARRGYVALPIATTTIAAPAPERTTAAPAPRPVPESSEPAPLPAVASPVIEPTAPVTTPSVVDDSARQTGIAPAAGLRLRPDANKHVDLLLSNATADRAATEGWQAYQRGDVAAARVALGTAAASGTAAPWVHYALGMAEYALREYRNAADEWEKVRRAAADFEPVYFDLVDSYVQLKEYDAAIRVLRDSAGRWPHDPEVFNALGVVQTLRGAVDDAIKTFQQAVSVAPSDSIGYYNLGRAFEMRYVKSRRYVQQLRAWVSNESDKTAAIENYQRHIDAGGPYAESALQGISRLKWAPNPERDN